MPGIPSSVRETDVRALPAAGPASHYVTMLLGVWLIVGAFVDGFAHNHGVVETFFTPWHAILYSGYLACAAWMGVLTYRSKKRRGYASWSQAIPEGYRLGLSGVAVFFVGGVGDMLWHILFGIEKNIAALLSPTHLLLLSGALLILTSPYRALVKEELGDSPAFLRLLPALVSIALTFALMGFFLMYAWSFRHQLLMAQDEDSVSREVVDFLLTTILLMVPVMVILRRWKLPAGAVTVIFGIESMLMAVLDGFHYPDSVVVLVVSGIVADVLFRAIKRQARFDWTYRAVFFAIPVLIWGLHFAHLQWTGNLRWAAELWGGVIFLSGLVSMGFSLLANPRIGANGH